ncbi:MAG: VTT domain-containing protein [Candidatus Bathyarchaeota archaeon]|nr:VTT domain-containing protein [Candidatus Bathyarchaeota archaeon]
MVDLWAWMTQMVSTYGYMGAFVISLFGNFTVFFPVPFTVTIYAFGATLNPLILGLVCGIGSTIGEFSAYLIGSGGRRILNDKYGERLETAKLLIQSYGMWIIFLFALLPLPDDLILIPLGMLRYNLKKAMTAMFIGKTLMCAAVAYAGKYSYTFIRDIFASSGILGGVLSTVLLALVMYAMIKIDWTTYIEIKPENS